MAPRIGIPALAAMLVAVPVPARGQVQAITLFAQGGGYSALRNLDYIGTADFKTGFTVGGGVGVQIDENIELRASVAGAQSHFQTNGAETGVYLNRYYFAGDIKGHYSVRGVTPYGLVGGGVVLLHEKATSGTDKAQGFVHLGLGLSYAIRQAGLSVFTQGDWFVYSLSELTGGALRTYTRTQFDLGWSAGVSYRLAL